ncbi:helix-turn-helix transcriptional regulator [Oceanobacillus jeddahense]|uniref:helix-turn-helix transcriptional regulator n=1 Tax=Oceanobacillus jeddahense TaxID=1462527 RepID=UPI003626364E
MNLKSNINKIIQERGLKNKWVANQLGVSPNIISRWVNNKSMPSVEKLFLLAKLLDCKVDDLYYWDENE